MSLADWRPTALGVYFTAAAYYVWRWGIPVDRAIVILWCSGAALIATRSLTPVVRDWLPIAAIMIVYDLTRGAVDQLGMPVQVQLPVRIDEALFGTLPTTWLQDRLLRRDIAWWESITALAYVSHFVVPFAVGFWLWIRHREAWNAWRRLFLSVTAIGLVGYTLLPTSPPWLSATRGAIDPVARVGTRGMRPLGLHGAERLVDFGQRTVNQVAAFPSLHAAFTVVTAVVLWPWKWARPVLVVYPVVMAFALVWSGEHYVVDVLAGWFVVAVAAIGWRWADARRV